MIVKDLGLKIMTCWTQQCLILAIRIFRLHFMNILLCNEFLVLDLKNKGRLFVLSGGLVKS